MTKSQIILFFFCLISISLQFPNVRSNEETIQIKNYFVEGDCITLNETKVNIELSSYDDKMLEEAQCVLSSTQGVQITSNKCEGKKDTTSISCTFSFTQAGFYTIKEFTSKNYKYTVNAPLSTLVMINYVGCTITKSPDSLIYKGASFEITAQNCDSQLLYVKRDNTYHQLSCSEIGGDKYLCSLPSTFSITNANKVKIAARDKCGKLIDVDKELNAYEVTLKGDKYINIKDNTKNSYKYTITSSTLMTPFKLEAPDGQTIEINDQMCKLTKENSPNIRECTLETKYFSQTLYNLKCNEVICIKEAIVVYEPYAPKVNVVFEESKKKIEPSTEKIPVKFTFDGEEIITIDDEPTNNIRGIKLESNNQKVTFTDECIPIQNDVNCWIKAEERNTFITFFYKNKTEHYVEVGKLEVGVDPSNSKIDGNNANNNNNTNNAKMIKTNLFILFALFFL